MSISRLLLSLSLVLVPSSAAWADEPGLLTLGASFNVPYQPGEMTGYGVGAMGELKYNINSMFSAGVRAEYAAILGGSVNAASGDVDLGARAVTIYSLKAEAKPIPILFGGLCLGYYREGSSNVSGGTAGGGVSAAASKDFGVAPQVGLDLGGFRLAAVYHIIFGTKDVQVSTGNVKEFSRNFLAVELGGQWDIM